MATSLLWRRYYGQGGADTGANPWLPAAHIVWLLISSIGTPLSALVDVDGDGDVLFADHAMTLNVKALCRPQSLVSAARALGWPSRLWGRRGGVCRVSSVSLGTHMTCLGCARAHCIVALQMGYNNK